MAPTFLARHLRLSGAGPAPVAVFLTRRSDRGSVVSGVTYFVCVRSCRRHGLHIFAIRESQTGTVGDRLPRGATLRDRWISDEYAGVLFWVDGGDFDVWGMGLDVLHCVTLKRSA